MSASLVGSEMCIRDRRLGVGRTQDRGASRDLRRWGESDDSTHLSFNTGCCLLYTSDAADDM
eukprot:1438922-Alexandrium_andersonii.AAC.1